MYVDIIFICMQTVANYYLYVQHQKRKEKLRQVKVVMINKSAEKVECVNIVQPLPDQRV